ncbi:MAG TPA: SLC13 family permease, partial [Fimbriimonas sp.]
LLIPLSYASILGGCVTLIGTSTNLVVNGLLIKNGLPGLGMFTFSAVGLPCALVGLGTILIASKWLLPDRTAAVSLGDDARRYTFEMIVDPKGPLGGKTVEAAGLRHLTGCFLAEVERNDELFPAVGPHFVVNGGDRLVFVGVVDSVKDLQRIRGLLPAGDQVYKLDVPRPQRALVEAVVSEHNPVVGKTIREARFRNMYNAVVIAVARGSQKLEGKLGDIVLRAGDVLLLETRPAFHHQQRNSRDFYLVSNVPDSAPIRHEKGILSVAILVAMIVAASTNLMDILPAALLAGGAMLATRCTSAFSARRNIDWQVLVVIAASFGLGTALTKTGAAGQISAWMVDLSGTSPWLNLAMVYLVTMVFTEILSNNAAAALMFPIALSLSKQLGASYMPFTVAIMMAASFGFATPIGYQTNLMVYGPGGYKFSDFLKLGLLLDILLGVVAVLLIPRVFPF